MTNPAHAQELLAVVHALRVFRHRPDLKPRLSGLLAAGRRTCSGCS